MRAVLFLVAVSILLSSLPPAPAAEATTFSWSTPPEFVGDLAIRFAIHPATTDDCRFAFRLEQRDVQQALHAYVWTSTGRWLASWISEAAQVHHGDMDTRNLVSTARGGASSIEFASAIAESGPETLSVLFISGAPVSDRDGTRPAFQIEIECPAGGAIRLDAVGRAPLLRNEQEFAGTGASANPHPAIGASVASVQHHTALAGTAEIHLRDDVGVGRFRIDTPGGPHETPLPTTLILAGPPGAYAWSIVRISGPPLLMAVVGWEGPEAAPT